VEKTKDIQVGELVGNWSKEERTEICKDFIDKIKKQTGSWTRLLTPQGKVRIWTSIIGGKLNYIGHLLELNKTEILELDKIARNYFCGNKWKDLTYWKDRKESGGLGAKLPSEFIRERKRRWMKEVLSGDRRKPER
jgi:hypothetical protein